MQSITEGAPVGFGGTTGAREQRSTVAPATWDPSKGRTIIQTQNQTCNILTLNLGAIHLDLLGLVVDLSPVNLTINAQQGAGNLLGNLLCAVANLLNPGGGLPTGGALGQITGLLSTIANLLNGILGNL